MNLKREIEVCSSTIEDLTQQLSKVRANKEIIQEKIEELGYKSIKEAKKDLEQNIDPKIEETKKEIQKLKERLERYDI